MSGPRARARAQPAGRLKRVVRHRHQLCLGRRSGGAIFDGKKGKRADDTPAEGSKSKELRQKNKRGKKGKKPRREAHEKGRDDDDGEALAGDPARGALDRPLEARGFSTTC
jgi:hypothetical protein